MDSTTWLAFETSCDETSVAVGRGGLILANVVSSQAGLHAEYGGVVPELAAREHLRNLRPVARQALREGGVTTGTLGLVAATQGPGLPSALMVGLKAAQSLAFTLRKPFFGIHHHEAHLYSPWIGGDPLRADFAAFRPNVALIVSGGHTLLVRVGGEFEHWLLGSTLDDAAGECFDKVGKLLGLPYPGGPAVDRLAAEGDPRRFDFPRPLRGDESDDFSFSGLKTSVRYFVRDHPELLDDGQAIRDLCAGVQAAIVDVLVSKTVRAARRLGVKCVSASGGVTCNSRFRRDMREACSAAGMELRLAECSLATDNAAMVGVVAERRYLHGMAASGLDEDIRLGWALPGQETL
jgi:N6-L-threonylcarbamoyladenine synthase